MKQLIALIVVTIIGSLWVKTLQDKIDYVDTECPLCGSVVVLDFGKTEEGQHCHCCKCGREFYLLSEDGHE